MIRIACVFLFAVLASCTGGPSGCESLQCIRAYECTTSCSSRGTSNGCCPCTAPAFDFPSRCFDDGGTRDGG